MSRLAIADSIQTEAIYRESHAVWGGGLSSRDYRGLWEEISSTAWARKYLRFFVWLGERGEVLSSLKLYRPLVRTRDSTTRTSIIGAVFTPRSHRRQGHAAALVRAVLARSRKRGDRLSLLFSDIGTDYYGKLGFHPLPAEEQWGTLPRPTAAVDRVWHLRTAGADDLLSMQRAHEATSRPRSIAVVRDTEHWLFLGLRSQRFFERLNERGIRQRVWVASRDDAFAGYLISVEGRGEWSVREVATVGGDPPTMATIIRLCAAEAYRSRLRRFYAWFPSEVAALLADWRIRSGPRRRAIPMIRRLSGSIQLEGLDSVAATYIPYQDQF